MTSTPRKRNKILMTTTLSPEVHARLGELAQQTGVAQNSLIEQALRLLFAQQEAAEKHNATLAGVALG